jgi:uncharacterized protein (DUF433 family)
MFMNDHISPTGPNPDPDPGLYTLPQASRLAQVARRTVFIWIYGRRRRTVSKRRDPDATVRYVPARAISPPAPLRRLTFQDLLTLRVVKAVQRTGYKIEEIRRVAARARVEWGCRYPLVTERFRAQGADMLLALEDAEQTAADPDGQECHRDPIERQTWRRIFAEVVDRTLFADVDWRDGAVVRWWPQGHRKSVVIDPDILAGAPHIAATFMPTATLAAAVGGGGDAAIRAAAAAHGIAVEQARDALRFETEWLTVDSFKNGSSRRSAAATARRLLATP